MHWQKTHPTDVSGAHPVQACEPLNAAHATRKSYQVGKTMKPRQLQPPDTTSSMGARHPQFRWPAAGGAHAPAMEREEYESLK